jgi:hypothetical protein
VVTLTFPAIRRLHYKLKPYPKFVTTDNSL